MVVAVRHVTGTLQAGYGDAFIRTTQTMQLNTYAHTHTRSTEGERTTGQVCNVNRLALLLVGYEANAGMRSTLAD
jgi:hypothetical protein